MATRATTIAQGFSNKLMLEMYDRDLTDIIANRNYQGEINAVGSKLNILNFDRLSEKTYANSALSADDLTENNATLVIDQYKSFYWKEKDLANWLSYIKDPHPTIVSQVANERNKNKETFLLGFYGDVAAGNRVGTDYTTGTVTVDVTTGAVTGSGTTFTSAMVGKGFKATGHTKWYRVKTYTDATTIVIEDDKDDATSAYTGGAIAAGASYTIEAATVVSITTTNLLQYVASLRLKLDQAEKFSHSSVPDTDRVLVVPPEFMNTVVRATGIALHVPEVYSQLIQKGYVGDLLGFHVYVSNRLTGDNTNGYHCLAVQKNWITMAEKVIDARMEEDIIGDFGTAYKDLFVYGAKVTDSRRHYAAEGFFTFA